LSCRPGLGQRAQRGQQDVGGNVDPVVVARVQVLDEQAAGPQVSAADLEHPHARLEAVRHQVVELHLAELEPRLVGMAADRALVAAGCVGFHHRAVVAHVVAGLQPQHRVPGQPAGVRNDAFRVTGGVPDLERHPRPILGVHSPHPKRIVNHHRPHDYRDLLDRVYARAGVRVTVRKSIDFCTVTLGGGTARSTVIGGRAKPAR
jgi:hypothetical protein